MSDSLDTLRTEGPDPDLEARALGHWALSEAGVEAPGGLVTVAASQQAALVAVAVEAAVIRQEAFEIASAKLLAGRAAITATRAAHQVHGAVGVTRAHPLSVQTRRLWAWRCEYGDEQLWAEILGDAVRHGGADSLYPTITAGSREGRP